MRNTKGQLDAPLLKRIETGGAVVMSPSHWIAEIGESLSTLFNTHVGSAAIDESYGLAEFHPDEIAGSVRLSKKADELVQLIQKFEPRLKQVKVEARIEDENTGRAIFEVQGMLDETLSDERVSYHTVMTGHGRVWLRK